MHTKAYTRCSRPLRRSCRERQSELPASNLCVQNSGLWRTRVWNVDHEVYVGHFKSPSDAGKAYDRAAIR